MLWFSEEDGYLVEGGLMMISWLSQAWSSVSPVFGGLTSLLTVVIAYFALVWPLRYQRSAAVLAQAVLSLERAYDALTIDGSQTAPVPASRLNWLTAARNIETYKALKRKIRVGAHILIADGHEEYWRHRFYRALQAPAYHQPSYYYPQGRVHGAPQSEQIEPRSAIIVHAFAKWPEGRRDPIDHADFHRIFSETDPRPGNVGLKIYLDDPEILGNALFRDLPNPYSNLTWLDRFLGRSTLLRQLRSRQ